ncbi:MAG TPA: hypothetical protein VGI90_14675 [Steroidobacteraceae bacterium]|jgi:methylated-DNA-[protein]-cysteine S-methyltransferase
MPPLRVLEAVTAAKRYFLGEKTDFSGLRLDLDEQSEFFKQAYAAARSLCWTRRPPMALWRRNWPPDLKGRVI